MSTEPSSEQTAKERKTSLKETNISLTILSCTTILYFYCTRLIKGWVFKKRRQKEIQQTPTESAQTHSNQSINQSAHYRIALFNTHKLQSVMGLFIIHFSLLVLLWPFLHDLIFTFYFPKLVLMFIVFTFRVMHFLNWKQSRLTVNLKSFSHARLKRNKHFLFYLSTHQLSRVSAPFHFKKNKISKGGGKEVVWRSAKKV